MTAVEIPKNVKWAVWVLYASLGLGVFRTIVDASEMGKMAAELLVYCLVGVVIYRISKGRNWARILYLFLVVFNLLLTAGAAWHGFDLPADLLPATTTGRILSYIETAAGIVAAVLLFGKPASRWFEDRANIR